MKKLFFMSVMFVFLGTLPALAEMATPTIVGGTGLIRMPTAVVLGPKEYNIAVDYGTDSSTNAAGSQTKNISYKINLGSMLGGTKGLELGIVGKNEPGSDRIREGVFINMKYSLSSGEDPDALHLAIGLENLASYNETAAYMVASKYLNNGVGLHFGAMFDFASPNFRPLGMAGLGFPLGGRDLVLMGEVFAGESLFQADAGARLMINRNFALLFRALNISNNAVAKDPQSYYIGLSVINPI